MITMAAVTMFFLPGTFVSVSHLGLVPLIGDDPMLRIKNPISVANRQRYSRPYSAQYSSTPKLTKVETHDLPWLLTFGTSLSLPYP